MMKRVMIVFVVLAALTSVAQAESTAAKKDLVLKMLKLQQPAIELAAQALAERPAVQMMQQANLTIQSRIAPDKREAIFKEIQIEVKKYVDQTVPLARERAIKVAPSTIGTMLDEKFNEQELTELIAVIESPVYRKYSQLGGDMQKVLTIRLVSELNGTIEPKVKFLEQSIIKSLGLPVAAATGVNAPAKLPDKAVSK